jgi:hypothetical protein
MATPRRSSEADAPAVAGGDAAGGGHTAAGSDVAAAMATLRERGAHRADPVRFRFIEALARRAEGQPAAVRQLLDAKLTRALAEYQARYAGDLHGETPPPAPGLAAGPAPGPTAGPLAELVQSLARTPAVTAAPGPTHSKRSPAATPELQALDYFRHTWAKLAVHRSMNQSLAKTPKNAGPLNSHRLVLRSLEVMREVSPAYLNRFVTYVDALLVLDGMGTATPAPPPAATPPAEGEKKRKAARGAGTSGRG